MDDDRLGDGLRETFILFIFDGAVVPPTDPLVVAVSGIGRGILGK